ncbi:MAG: hypothetical protein ACOY4F_01505 [Thermodesulfobacteriota bacterium]
MQHPDAGSTAYEKSRGEFSLEDRVEACLVLHEELKERKTLREVLEERVFLECIRVSRDRINEFPLLEIEQKSLIDMLLRRSADHPGHMRVKGLIGEFIAVLNRYGKARAAGAQEAASALFADLSRAEALLVKAVQGAVYCGSLIKDNVSDAIIKHFGESSVGMLDEITARCEFDEHWWRAVMNAFARERIAAGHAGMVAGEKYSVFREGGFVGVRLPFDAVLAELGGTDKAIQKTRVQNAFEDLEKADEGRRVVAALNAFLSSGEGPVSESGSAPAVGRHLARIAAMDPAGTDYAVEPSPDEDPSRRDFLAAQVTALATGAGLVLAVVTSDFERAIRDFDARERRIILAMTGRFERDRLERTMPLVLEFAYLNLLREMGREEGGKVVFRTVRVRRAVAVEVQALADQPGGGLTRIGRRRLFEDDPEHPDMLVWKPRTVEELGELCAVLQLDETVAAKIAAMWETAPFRVDILVAVNLEAVARVTPSPALRVAEILARFGVAPRRAARSPDMATTAGQTPNAPPGADQGEDAP